MKVISTWLSRVIVVTIVIFLVVLILLTSVQVANRFVLRLSLPWIPELITLCFAWLICLGAAVGVKESSHLSLDLVAAKLTPAGQLLIALAVDAAMLLTGIVYLSASLSYVTRNATRKLATLDLPSNVLYSATVVSAVCMIIFLIEIVYEDLCKRKKL